MPTRGTGADGRGRPVDVPRAKVGLSTASVYPEGVAAAFELAARLGYDGVEVMVWTDPVSQESFTSVVEALSTANAALQLQVRDLELELRHAALIHRDHAIGLMATAEKLRQRHEISQSSLRRARDKATRLQKRNAAMRASATWRIGSFFVRPLTFLRRR